MAANDVHHLLLYEYVEGMADRREPHREAHLERIRAEREAGRIAVAGGIDPPAGAAIVFKGVDRGHVEAFVADDPYVVADLVASWRVQRWNLL